MGSWLTLQARDRLSNRTHPDLELEWTLGRRGQEKVKGFISTPSSLPFPSFWPSLTPLSTNLFLSPTFRCSKNQRWQLYNSSRREWYTSNHSPKSRLRRLREHLFYRPLSVADRKGIETRGLGAGTQQHPPLQTSVFFYNLSDTQILAVTGLHARCFVWRACEFGN